MREVLLNKQLLEDIKSKKRESKGGQSEIHKVDIGADFGVSI